MEVWHRKKRQFLCDNEQDSYSPAGKSRDDGEYSDEKTTCLIGDDDLETATCADRKKTLADAFKTDIECGWGGAAGMCPVHRYMTAGVFAVAVACMILF